jgi:hypothetical protein
MGYESTMVVLEPDRVLSFDGLLQRLDIFEVVVRSRSRLVPT